MTLQSKKYSRIHNKTGAAFDAMKASFDGNEHATLEQFSAEAGLIYQIGAIQDELDALRGEITNNGDGVGGALSRSGGIMTGDLVTTRKYELPNLEPGNASGGDIYYHGVGETIAGVIYYLQEDGVWTIADANSAVSSRGLLGVALGVSPEDNGMLIRGFCTLKGAVGSVDMIGVTLYLSTEPGSATVTQPSGTTDIVRVLGYSLHTTGNQIYFNPDNIWIELA